MTYPGTQAVSRAIQLLKCFDDQHSRWTLGGLVQETGLKKTTVYRLLSVLEAEQLLWRDAEQNQYRLGPALIALGGTAMRQQDLRQLARPLLQQLAQETDETSTLEILRAGQVLVVDEASGSQLLGATRLIGLQLPWHATSTGKAMVAHLSPAEQADFLGQALVAHTAHTRIDPVLLKTELDQIRRQGYALSLEELELGFAAVSVPVFNHDGYPVAAVSVDGPRARLCRSRLEKLGLQLQPRVRQLSAQLGFHTFTAKSAGVE